MSSQAGPVLEDQLESDRTRQFQEFLDDRVPPLHRSVTNISREYTPMQSRICLIESLKD
jgi:hypothetical protein